MKTLAKALATLAVSGLLAVSVTSAASAQSAKFSGATCGWPMHVFLEIKSTGTQYLKVTGTNDEYNTFYSSETGMRRSYVNSPTQNAKSGYASTSASSWFHAGWGCSI